MCSGAFAVCTIAVSAPSSWRAPTKSSWRIDDRASGRGQFHGRCLTYNAMDHAANVESPDGGKQGRPLFSRDEIKALFEHMPVRMTEGGLDLIWAIACIPGYSSLRTVKRLLEMAYRKWADKTIGRDEMHIVLQLFFGSARQARWPILRSNTFGCIARQADS